jgi:predicted nucleic acid-binding protein
MPFVLDASMTMSWCFADESTPYGRNVLQLLLTTYAEVPAVWIFEVANVLAIGERKQRIAAPLSDEFMKTLSGLDIRNRTTYSARDRVAPASETIRPDRLRRSLSGVGEEERARARHL